MESVVKCPESPSATVEETIAQLHAECRALREKQFEKEIVFALFRSVICIADRCRREIRQLQTTLKAYGADVYRDVVSLSLKHLIDSRTADLIEIEAILTQFNIEKFHCLSNQFDPTKQTAVKLSSTQKQDLHQQISSRLLPGYRRGNTLVRRECVAVYVHKPQEETQS